MHMRFGDSTSECAASLYNALRLNMNTGIVLIRNLKTWFDSMSAAEKAGLGGLLALSLLLKLWNVLDPFRLGFHSDEAILGLMAKHFWEGQFAYFYYGQTYAGGLEYVLGTLFYGLLPHGVAPLRVTCGLMMLGAEVLVYFCARAVFSSPVARLATVLIFLCGSFVIPWDFSHSFGIHLNNCLAFAILLAVYVNADRLLPHPAVIGLVVGTGLWVSNFIWVMLVFCAAIPLLGGVSPRRYLGRTELRGVCIVLVFMALGALPRILYLMNSDDWNIVSPMGGYLPGSPGKIANTASMLVNEGLPRFLLGDYANRYASGSQWLMAAWLLLLVWALIVATIKAHRARGLLWAVTGCTVATALLVVTNAFTYDSGWRYVWPLLFAMAFHTGLIFDVWHTDGMPLKAPIALPVLLLVIGAAIGLWANVVAPRLIMPEHNPYAPVIAALERNGCQYGYSYWEYAYPIDFLTEERIILESTGLRRVGAYGARVAAAHKRCYLFPRPAPGPGPDLLAYWQRNGIRITEQSFGEVSLIVEHMPGS
jgi:hypothetical protein